MIRYFTAIWKSKIKLCVILIPHTTINSKQIKTLNVKIKTMQALEERIGKLCYNNRVGGIKPVDSK